MDQTTLNYIIVGLSFALYFAIAVVARASSTGEFYAAGRGVNPVVNGMATAADWMSAASFISMAGLIAFTGYDNSTYLMGWTGGYVLLAMLLAPYLRKFGKYTVPEFIGDRFYSQIARIVAVVCLIVISVTYVIGQMTGVGVTFARFLEVDATTGLIIGAAVVFVYAVLGGMKGITYTQVAQYVVLITAYTIPAVFISLNLTGNAIPPLGLFSDHVGTGQPLLVTLNQVVTDLGFSEYTSHNQSTLNMVLFTMSLMIGTAGLPHVIIRFFTVPRVADARWSAGWALVFIAALYLVAPAVGAMARLNLVDTVVVSGAPGTSGDVGTTADEVPAGTTAAAAPAAGGPVFLPYEERPDWMRTWESTGLLTFEDKNGDGRIQYYNDKNAGFTQTAQGYGWNGNELTVNNDILVLANPEIAQLPGWVIALVAAGGLAAALSTAAGLLLAIASAISHDLVKSVFNPGISERGELFAARLAMTGAIALATYLGLNPPGFAAQTVALAFGLAAATIFPALMMGIFSKRVNSAGAICGMLVGLGVTVAYVFTYLGVFFVAGTNLLPNDSANWLFGISPASFGTIGAVANFAVAFLVSGLTQEPPQRIRDLVESVRIPRGAGTATAHH